MDEQILVAQATPPPRTPSSPGATPTAPPRTGTTVFEPPTEVSNRDVWIGAVFVLVLVIVFWLVKRAMTRHLIEQRASIDKAARAGFMLWVTLMSLSLLGASTFVARKSLLTGSFSLALLLNSTWGLTAIGCFVVFVLSLLFFLIFWRSARQH